MLLFNLIQSAHQDQADIFKGLVYDDG